MSVLPPPGHILVVEDDDELRENLAEALESVGYTARVAGSGPDGLRAIALERPHLVLLDIAMPGMTGLDVLAELQRSPELATIPVVVVSGHSGPLPAGAIARLEKPFGVERLLSLIARTLERIAAAR